MSKNPTHSTESAKVAQAFADYIGMGPRRSLRSLTAVYAEQNLYESSSSAFRSLSEWSSQHRWQERIAEAVSNRATQVLTEESELDVEMFLATSCQHHPRILDSRADKIGLTSIHSIRDQVQRPAGQMSGLTVNVMVLNGRPSAWPPSLATKRVGPPLITLHELRYSASSMVVANQVPESMVGESSGTAVLRPTPMQRSACRAA